jgi:hypothetical protein
LTGVWIGHVIAGILGVLLSLSVVFQQLERVFSVHKKLNDKDIERIREAGQDLSNEAREEFVSKYNRLIYMGKNPNLSHAHPYDAGVSVFLKSGERIQVVSGPKFYEVKRTKKNGKPVFYRLLEKRPAEEVPSEPSMSK